MTQIDRPAGYKHVSKLDRPTQVERGILEVAIQNSLGSRVIVKTREWVTSPTTRSTLHVFIPEDEDFTPLSRARLEVETLSENFLGIQCLDMHDLIYGNGDTQSNTHVGDLVESPNVLASRSLDVEPTCTLTDEYFLSILFPELITGGITNGQYHKRAAILVVDGEPLGIMKLKGNRLFLSGRTVINDDSYALVRGGIFSVPKQLSNSFPIYRDTWQIHNVSNLRVRPNRMLHTVDSISPEYAASHPYNTNNILNRLDEVLAGAKRVLEGESNPDYVISSCQSPSPAGAPVPCRSR